MVQPQHGRRAALLHHHPHRAPDHPPPVEEAGPGQPYRGGSIGDITGEDSPLLPGNLKPGVTRRKWSSVEEPVNIHSSPIPLLHLPKPFSHHGRPNITPKGIQIERLSYQRCLPYVGHEPQVLLPSVPRMAGIPSNRHQTILDQFQ